jgi:hypothetical protein
VGLWGAVIGIEECLAEAGEVMDELEGVAGALGLGKIEPEDIDDAFQEGVEPAFEGEDGLYSPRWRQSVSGDMDAPQVLFF